MNKTITAVALVCLIAAPLALAESYKERMARARELRLTGHTDEALELYNVTLEQSHRDVDALVGRGYCYIRQSDHVEQALADFDKAITLVPTYVDAYIGAAIVHRRRGNWKEVEAIFLRCEEACVDNAKRKRYLASAAWRERQFILARRLDDEYPPEPDRVLDKTPSRVTVSTGLYWLERGEDWNVFGLSASHKVRPDFTVSASIREWLRYGENDLIFGAGVSYRHSYRSSISYRTYASDPSGFLAERKHRVMGKYDLFKRTTVGGGISASNYGEDWSRRLLLSVKQKVDNFHASYRLSTGHDTKGQNVAGHTIAAGYSSDLRYSLSASYRWGEETVDLERGDRFEFRTDRVETARISGTYYINDLTSVSAGYMREWREGELFRRGVSLSATRRF